MISQAPSHLCILSYLQQGVRASKLHIVPIAVNTTLFNPSSTKPFDLPKGQLIFGRHRRTLTAVSLNG